MVNKTTKSGFRLKERNILARYSYLTLATALIAIAMPQTDGKSSVAQAKNSSIIKVERYGPGVSKQVKLGLNKAIVIDLPKDAHDILVADPTLADAVTRTSRRIYMFGRAVGQTNIFVFGENGQELINLDLVIERDVSGLQAQLNRFVKDADINVEIISDNIVLTGTVRTPQDASRAVQLAEIFLSGGEATTRNVTATGDGAAAIFAEDRQESQIVNLLQIDGEDQVTLKVTIAEVSRQILKQLGVNTSVSGASGQVVGNFASGMLSGLGKPFDDGTQNYLSGTSGNTSITGFVNAMEQAGVMRTLAEPSLTAISGESASFYVGGDFNLVTGYTAGTTVVDDGAITTNPGAYDIQTIEYGIRLEFKPVVLGPGRISLRVNTEVSEPTFEGSVSQSGQQANIIDGVVTGGASGATFLSVRRREAQTSVELPSGGSMVIAGLVKDNIRQVMSGLPGASKIPILGTLFRSKDFVRNENELVIIATPYLVKPVSRQKLARPDDNFAAVNDISSYFLGRVNRIYGNQKGQAPKGQYHGAVGFIYK